MEARQIIKYATNVMKTDSLINYSMKTNTSSTWTFFSNHAHVLLCLHRDNDCVLRDVAVEVGITERAVQKIVSELEAADVLKKTKVGRCNTYTINEKINLRHAIESHRSIGDLLRFIEN